MSVRLAKKTDSDHNTYQGLNKSNYHIITFIIITIHVDWHLLTDNAEPHNLCGFIMALC